MKRWVLMLLFGLFVAALWFFWPRQTAVEPTDPVPKPVNQPQVKPPEKSDLARPALRVADIGRHRPDEGNPEGPMSLAIGRGGELIVLDQVNGRLLRAGKANVALPVTHAQDVLVTSKGLAVLDRLVDRKVVLMDDAGTVTGALPLLGKGLKDGGGVTGIFEDKGNIYAEREHGMLVELGTVDGEASKTRTELPGRPSRDGRLLLTAGTPPLYVSAIDRASGSNRFTRQLTLNEKLRGIAHLDSDATGLVQLVVVLEDQHLLFCLSGEDGHTVAQKSLPISHQPEETFRTFATRDDGTLVQMLLHEDAIEYLVHACS